MSESSSGKLITNITVGTLCVLNLASFFPGAVGAVFGVDTDLVEIGRLARRLLLPALIGAAWLGRRHIFKYE